MFIVLGVCRDREEGSFVGCSLCVARVSHSATSLEAELVCCSNSIHKMAESDPVVVGSLQTR